MRWISGALRFTGALMAIGSATLCGCAATMPHPARLVPEVRPPPPGGVWLLYIKGEPVAQVEVTEPSRGNRVDVEVRDNAVKVTLKHQGAARLTPLAHQLEGGLPISFTAHSDGGSVLQMSLRLAVAEHRYRDASGALANASAEEFLALAKALTDETLLDVARSPEGLALLEQMFQALTRGSPSEDESQQAQRVLAAVAQLRTPAEFAELVSSLKTKRFPYRASGITVFNSTPLEVRIRDDGKLAVHLNSRVFSSEYREEGRTLEGLQHLVLDADEVVGVTLYDEGGREVYAPALFLVQLGNADDHQGKMKLLEAAGLGAGIGTGIVIDAGVEAAVLAKVLRWCDEVALVLGTATSILDEHRGWILSRFGAEGRAFLHYSDTVNSVTALYGMARLLMGAPKLVGRFRRAYGDLLNRGKALEGLTPDEARRFGELKGPMDDWFKRVDEIQSRRAGGGAGSDADAEVGAKVIPLDSARKPGPAPESGAQPVPAQVEEPLAATGTDGRLVPIRRQSAQRSNGLTVVASREQGPKSGVEPRTFAPPPAPTDSSVAQRSGGLPASGAKAGEKKPRLTAIRGGVDMVELSTEEYAAQQFAELERAEPERLPGSRAELERRRPDRARPPENVPADDPLWSAYADYYEARLREIDQYEGGGVAKQPENPLQWEKYRTFKTNVLRGVELENRFADVLMRDTALPPEQRELTRDMPRVRIDRRLGIAKENHGNTLYVDFLATDLDSLGPGQQARTKVFSGKSHDFNRMTETEVLRLVEADARELRVKYKAPFEVRRPGHPLFGQQVKVTELHMVYDAKMVADPQKQKAILEFLTKEHVWVHFR